jgi:hypothetical protein
MSLNGHVHANLRPTPLLPPNFAVLVDYPPQPVALALDLELHLQVPFVTRVLSAAARNLAACPERHDGQLHCCRCQSGRRRLQILPRPLGGCRTSSVQKHSSASSKD